MRYYLFDEDKRVAASFARPQPGLDLQLLPDGGQSGARWENGEWVAPEPEPEPIDPLTIELPRREFRRALLHNGMDTAAVLSVINAITDPSEREEMTIWWEDTQNFQRQHPVLVQMVAAAGLTPEQGDVIWTYGVGLLQGE